jgi:hypothetical protein
MKFFLQSYLVICLFLFSKTGLSQNVMLNVLTQHSGIVKINSIIFFEVTVSNTSPTNQIPAYKLRPQISFPSTLVEVPNTGHILPNGWRILSNKNGVVILSNGSDIISENGNRTILIALKGKTVGGPSTVIGNMFFSNGIAPGAEAGNNLKGDNTADNSSTSTIKVIK